MSTEFLMTSVNDIDMSFEIEQRDTCNIIQDLKTKLEKQSHSFLKLKQKIIATDSVLKSYKQTKEQLEEKEKQLESQRKDYENISSNYKNLLEKFIPIEKLYDEQKETLCAIQAQLQNVTGQKLAIEMHAKQLQVLVNNLESKLEVAKVEYQLLKCSHEKEKKSLTKESKSTRQRANRKSHSDLLMFGNAARKAGVLTRRQITMLERYSKSEETTCPDVEDHASDIDDLQMSPTYSTNKGILSCRSVDTGRGSSLMSSDDEKISDNVLCDLIDDSQITTPLCSPKTLDTIIDAGLLEAKLKSFCTTATSPVQRLQADASTSPIKTPKRQDMEYPPNSSIMRKLLTKQQLHNDVPDTKVNSILKEMITDYTLVSPIPWKESKVINRQVLSRNLSNKVNQHRSKLRYMLDRKKSRLKMQKAIDNIDRKINELLESKNGVRPPNISCLCNSKVSEPKVTEKLTSEEIINLVSQAVLQTSNQMNNSVVSTILNTLLPLNSIYSSFKAAEVHKSQEALNKCIDYILAHERIKPPSVTVFNATQHSNSNISSEKTQSGNEATKTRLSTLCLNCKPVNEITKNKTANSQGKYKNIDNRNDQCTARINALNKRDEALELLSTRKVNSRSHQINIEQSTESNSDNKLSNDSQTHYLPNLLESANNLDIVSGQNLSESIDTKKKRNAVEKCEIAPNNENFANEKECSTGTANAIAEESVYNYDYKKCSTATSNATLDESICNNLFGESSSDCHEELSDEGNLVPLGNKKNSTIKKTTKRSKVTKLQSLRKSLRSYNRKIQREPSPPPAKKRKKILSTLDTIEKNDKTSHGLKVSEVTTDLQENFNKAVKIMNEIKNKTLLEKSPVLQCKLKKFPIQKKPDVEEKLTNDKKSNNNATITEININDSVLLGNNTPISKLNTDSSIKSDSNSNLNSNVSSNVVSCENTINEVLNEEDQNSMEKSQHSQITDGSSERVINYNDLDMFTVTNHSDSSVKSPENSSETKSSGKSFFIAMIEKYSLLRKRKINHSEIDKGSINVTEAIQQCIKNILDSTLNEPIPEMNKLCENMIHLKPAEFARSVVDTLMGEKQPSDCLCRTYTPPAPPMYKSEQILLYVINKVQKSNNDSTVITTILDHIEYKLFRLGSTPEKDQVECLSRFFAVLCRHTKQMQKLRVFILDAMYCLNFKVLLVFHEVINVWSHIIPMASTETANDPLVLTIVHLLHFLNYNNEDKTQNIRKILVARYGYDPGSCNQQQLLKKLDSLLKGISIADVYNHKSLRLAFVLVGKRYGPQWCHKHLVNGIILPITSDPIIDQHVRAFAVSLLGPLIRPYPTTMSLHCEMTINKLTLLLEDGESPEIEEAAISSILMLKKFVYSRVLNTLQNWEPKRVISEELENQIKEFVREKQTGAWRKILEKM